MNEYTEHHTRRENMPGLTSPDTLNYDTIRSGSTQRWATEHRTRSSGNGLRSNAPRKKPKSRVREMPGSSKPRLARHIPDLPPDPHPDRQGNRSSPRRRQHGPPHPTHRRGRRRRTHHQHLGNRTHIHRMAPGRRRGPHDPTTALRTPHLPTTIPALRTPPRRPRPDVRPRPGHHTHPAPIHHLPLRAHTVGHHTRCTTSPITGPSRHLARRAALLGQRIPAERAVADTR